MTFRSTESKASCQRAEGHRERSRPGELHNACLSWPSLLGAQAAPHRRVYPPPARPANAGDAGRTAPAIFEALRQSVLRASGDTRASARWPPPCARCRSGKRTLALRASSHCSTPCTTSLAAGPCLDGRLSAFSRRHRVVARTDAHQRQSSLNSITSHVSYLRDVPAADPHPPSPWVHGTTSSAISGEFPRHRLGRAKARAPPAVFRWIGRRGTGTRSRPDRAGTGLGQDDDDLRVRHSAPQVLADRFLFLAARRSVRRREVLVVEVRLALEVLEHAQEEVVSERCVTQAGMGSASCAKFAVLLQCSA